MRSADFSAACPYRIRRDTVEPRAWSMTYEERMIYTLIDAPSNQLSPIT